MAAASLEQKPAVVFSDLDGTLLDGRDYSFAAAASALALLQNRDIPLVLCTSKTRAEVEVLRRQLGNRHPFIVENGGALYVPHGTFPFAVPCQRRTAEFQILELGTPYADLVRELAALKQRTGVRLRGFSDMSVAEVAGCTGLGPADAARAKEREFDEPFLVPHEADRQRVLAASRLPISRGDRFFHLASSDKGRAVTALLELYRRARPGLISIGLGNAANDRALLAAVDVPILVGRSDGGYDREVALPGLCYAEGTGPQGWNTALMAMLAAGGERTERTEGTEGTEGIQGEPRWQIWNA